MRAAAKNRRRFVVDRLEERCLLAVAVVEVLNQSSYTVSFDFRWTSSSSWTPVTEAAGQGELFWTNYSTSLTPQVLYDATTSRHSQTIDTLTQGYGEYTGTGTPPASAASLYAFQNTSTGVQLNYVPATTPPTDAVVDIANDATSTVTFEFRWSPSSSWTQYTEAPGQSQLLDTTYASTLSPQVMYDTTSSTSSATTVGLSNGFGEWTGTGTPPTSAAVDYSFQPTSTGVTFVYGTGTGGGGGGGGTGSTLPPNPNAVYSSNWSGYAAATNLSSPAANSVTYVAGSWVVPTVTATSGTTYSSVWVGIDGYSDSTVEQLGTEEDIINGKPQYDAWWEMYSSITGQPEQVISSMAISPGDSITASVTYETSGAHSGQFLLSITDSSKSNDSFSIYETSSQVQNPTAQRSSAEWIVEAPTIGNSVAKVANFGTVSITNASATINGVTGAINNGSWQSQAIDMGSKGAALDVTSVLNSSGSGFNVTYGSTGAPSSAPKAASADFPPPPPSSGPLVVVANPSIPPRPAVVVVGSTTPAGYHSPFRPAQAIARPLAGY